MKKDVGRFANRRRQRAQPAGVAGCLLWWPFPHNSENFFKAGCFVQCLRWPDTISVSDILQGSSALLDSDSGLALESFLKRMKQGFVRPHHLHTSECPSSKRTCLQTWRVGLNRSFITISFFSNTIICPASFKSDCDKLF